VAALQRGGDRRRRLAQRDHARAVLRRQRVVPQRDAVQRAIGLEIASLQLDWGDAPSPCCTRVGKRYCSVCGWLKARSGARRKTRIIRRAPLAESARWDIGMASAPAPSLRDAKALHRAGDLAGAERAYDALLRVAPDDAEALQFLGVLRLQQGRRAEAVALLERALAIAPANLACLNNLGNALHAAGRHADAAARYRAALESSPGNPEILANLGSALAAAGRYEDALAACDAALSAGPRTPRVLVKRAIALSGLDRLEEALVAFDEALSLDPSSAEAHRNRGVVLHALARDGEAISAYRRAIELQPADPEAHWNLGHALLRAGRAAEAWPEYEWRWKKLDHAGLDARVRGPRWGGLEPLAGRTLLVHAEQGIGDTLLAVRRIAPLARAGARVVLEVQPRLVPLLAGLPGVDGVIARGDPLPPYDLQCPLLSLPLALSRLPASVAAAVPYLAPDTSRVARWREVLSPVPELRAALVWSGARSYGNDRKRSIPPSEVAPLLSVPGVRWYALQNDVDDDARAAFAEVGSTAGSIEYVGERLPDFAEIAAFMANLDLVVTVDTSFGNLAGALGRPLWMLLPRSPDWRWGLGSDTGTWYPSARLFRQGADGRWPPVIARAVEALARQARVPRA